MRRFLRKERIAVFCEQDKMRCLFQEGGAMANYEAILGMHGARFQGKMAGSKEPLILFSCPASGSTLALLESEFCSDALAERLAKSRREYERGLAELAFSSTLPRSALRISFRMPQISISVEA